MNPRRAVRSRSGAPANDARRLRAAVLRWYRKHRRDLPWRRTRDPYAIWVSEIMLQQTRVETVIPFYERFLERFPTVGALARAPEPAVLAAWSGLGYYSRARSLRVAAGTVVREHAGRVPEEPEALRALPGIGPYTAAAIASVAYDRPAAAVDGNVIRVLARIEGRSGRRNDSTLRREVERFAATLASGPSPGDWTQALMELGALVCSPREPACGSCPAVPWCAAFRSGHPDRYPEPAAAAGRVPERRSILLVARRGDRVLLVPDGDPERRHWTCPIHECGSDAVAATSGAGAARGRSDGNARLAKSLLLRHLNGSDLSGPAGSFAHRTYSCLHRYEVWVASGGRRARSAGRARWVERDAMESLPLRAPTLKAFRVLRI
ncbi:MAG: A/G-specific adenine glycosylase [Bacteroidota bacterium]